MVLLELDDVDSFYGESQVLENVSIEANENETVAIIGRNGVGKTACMRTVLQLNPP
ncbi:MAG: ATP-binding cassette domain-containing protein, partial [Halobacteria archaeon]|nr:ATP-binding cassette domain-containing protein [Halobacteria archaeon]